MNVLVVEPGFLPYEKEISDSLNSDEHLRALQEIVGGWIEAIYPYDEEVAIATRKDLSMACLLTAAFPAATAAYSVRSLFVD